MQYSPHPLLSLSDIRPSPAETRFAALAESSRLFEFYNARGALFHLFKQLKTVQRRRVLMPAFHCISMIEPALAAGMEVSFYRIDRSLQIDEEDVIARASNEVCAFLYVNFFGFPAKVDALLTDLRRRGIAVVEDSSHSFLELQPLRLAGGSGDYIVYSFGKLVPCGAGGGLRVRAGSIDLPHLTRLEWKDSLVLAKRLIEQVFLSRNEQSVVRRFYFALEAARVSRKQHGPREQSNGTSPSQRPPKDGAFVPGNLAFDALHARTRFPSFPRWILHAANLHEIVFQRRRNYSHYSTILAFPRTPLSVLPQLHDSVCPWAYPILVANRAQHDQRLRSLGVPVWTFGDVLHPSVDQHAGTQAAADARFLSTHLLCLPVHQGLPSEAVASFAQVIAKANFLR